MHNTNQMKRASIVNGTQTDDDPHRGQRGFNPLTTGPIKSPYNTHLETDKNDAYDMITVIESRRCSYRQSATESTYSTDSP